MKVSETYIAALPMYDWPELREEVDALWSAIGNSLRGAGIDAPKGLVRRNADIPPVPDGIRDAAGHLVAPDPASLPPDELDLATLWRHPQLILAQTCWGPLETTDLGRFVTVLGQPDYSDVEGGEAECYSSVLLMRGDAGRTAEPFRREGSLPLELLRGKRLAFNSRDSMSGYLAVQRGLEARGETLAIFSEKVEAGSHRAAALAVAGGRADVAALDCRSWSLFKRFHEGAAGLIPVGWTTLRKGLPYVCAASLPVDIVERVGKALAG